MRQKLLAIVGLLVLALIVTKLPFERQTNDMSKLLYEWSDEQAEMSESVTNEAVSGAEGSLVGEHEINGSNWSIPNIVRHWLGR